MRSSDQDIVTALDELHEGFAIFDRELRLTLCNQSFCLLRGLPQEMCRPGTSLFDLFVFNAKRWDYSPSDAAAQASERIAEIGRREPREVLVDLVDGRKILARYRTRDEARADIFNYIERFYNPRRRHSTLGPATGAMLWRMLNVP